MPENRIFCNFGIFISGNRDYFMISGVYKTFIILKLASFQNFKVDRGGVPAVGGLKFSMAQQKVQKSASWGKCQLGEVPVGGSAS